MKKKEVPQDKGLMEGKFRDVCYALDESGHYVAVHSSGWQPKTDAMLQAWEVIHEKVEKIRQRVIAGDLSPIAFYMEKNIMDLKLLADYVDLPKRKVRKHLRPEVFHGLQEDILKRYAELFEITVEELRNYKVTLQQ